MKKTILPLCAVMLMSVGLASCGGPDTPASNNKERVHLSVWVPTAQVEWAEGRVLDFAAANPDKNYTITVTPVEEGNVQATIKNDPEASADVFLYAGDHLGPLTDAGYLADFPDTVVNALAEDIPVNVLNSGRVGGKLYGIPYTPNSYFMYYNGDKATADEAKSLDTLLTKGKVLFDIDNGWYQTAFWYGTGVRFFGESGADPTQANLDSEYGYAAARAIRDYVATENFVNGGDDEIKSQFTPSSDIVAVVGGSWLASGLVSAFGNTLKTAILPTFTEGGNTYDLMATGDWKKCGVSRYSDQRTEAIKLAVYLTNAESMLEKAEEFSETPVLTSLMTNPLIEGNDVMRTLMLQTSENCVLQPSIAQMSQWWDAATGFANALIGAESPITDQECVEWAKQLQEQLLATIGGGTDAE